MLDTPSPDATIRGLWTEFIRSRTIRHDRQCLIAEHEVSMHCLAWPKQNPEALGISWQASMACRLDSSRFPVVSSCLTCAHYVTPERYGSSSTINQDH